MMLIPGGSFEMGDHFGATPIHTVELDEFYMDVNGSDSRSVQRIC